MGRSGEIAESGKGHGMPDVPEPMVKLVRWTAEPAAAQVLRSTAAAVIAYQVAVWLLPQPAPLTAPLTALLVVQVTLYSTLRPGRSGASKACAVRMAGSTSKKQ